MMDLEDRQGGRIFFSSVGRSMETEDELELVSVGIDIGSSTSHLAFSKIILERLDTRYMVVERTLLHQSDVLLTPYLADDTIDAEALGDFIAQQYKLAGLTPDGIDTGALILTGVAVRRSNARAIGELFSAQSGRFVVVSAGDALETTLAAFGSGAVALSGTGGGQRVLNIDIGGGTSKLALAKGGAIQSISALDSGARIIAFDEARRVTRLEDAGRHFSRQTGHALEIGQKLSVEAEHVIAGAIADAICEAAGILPLSQEVSALHRLEPLVVGARPDAVTVSGGVSEFLYGREEAGFGDLGPALAQALRKRLEGWGVPLVAPQQGIRATVVGASQYTVQVSGSTIFVHPMELLPIRNIPVIKPALDFGDEIDPVAVARAVSEALSRLDLGHGETPVALYYHFQGSASFRRLDSFCRGVTEGLAPLLEAGHPVVLVANSDVGGLVGMHFLENFNQRRVVSIDGVELEEFEFIDIGAILETSGSVPVVVKSLVFPGHGLGNTATG
ncbi:ethanolamine ammonia-lyase reactivating factor EutA [Paracoccus sp. (in: a-proteobacteria)]|uniref:ethanolamine ammonia-lyase reactivating factor EutA n=1 Tax=Paracoccus sp. TaxID=267 RepID=UPI00289677CF|nr:ethanolamine ammonia-lyase reactivating factor EutA [Paracoccus sp. (in: a-proteobacteria)]